MTGENLPSIFVDRFYASVNPTHTRIVFGENIGDTDHGRAAIVIATSNARELATLLLDLINQTTDSPKEE